MSNTEKLSRRDLFGVSGMSAVGVLGAAALMSASAQAATAPSFIYKSINDYGASPTNTASANTTAIQNALNSLNSYDCLVFPPGTYNILTGLTFSGSKKHIHLIGSGSTLMVTGIGASNDVLTISGTDQNNTIENLSITGLTINNTATPPTANSGIVLSYALRVSLRDVSIFNMAQYCLNASNAWWLSTHNCVFGSAGIASVYHGANMNAVTHIATRFAPNTVAARLILPSVARFRLPRDVKPFLTMAMNQCKSILEFNSRSQFA